jgi:MraZ protein
LTPFRGTFEHTLDTKHRIPAKVRESLAGRVVLAASFETEPGAPCSVAIWKPDAFESYTTAALANLHPLSPESRALKRFFFNFSHDTEVDSAHRVMIPQQLSDYASLDKDVVVTGAGECLEVFDRGQYGGYRNQILSRVSDIAASLGHTA